MFITVTDCQRMTHVCLGFQFARRCSNNRSSRERVTGGAKCWFEWNQHVFLLGNKSIGKEVLLGFPSKSRSDCDKLSLGKLPKRNGNWCAFFNSHRSNILQILGLIRQDKLLEIFQSYSLEKKRGRTRWHKWSIVKSQTGKKQWKMEKHNENRLNKFD